MVTTEKVLAWDDAAKKVKEKSIVVGASTEFVSHDGTNNVVGSSGSTMPATACTRTVTFANAITATDQLLVEVQADGSGPWLPDASTTLAKNITNPTTQLDVAFLGSHIVPAMTSDTAPAGFVASGNSYISTLDYYLAFNHILTTDNKWASNSATGYLAIELPRIRNVSMYQITWDENITYINQNPKDWTFEGWDGYAWVVLDTQTNITTWSVSTPKQFYLATPAAYKKYRLNITANCGSATNVAIGELELFAYANWRVRKISF